MSSLPAFRDRVALGNELKVSPYCVGMSTPEAVVSAFERGINFFFVSADLHWPKYKGTREGLARLCELGLRAQFVVCVTSYMSQPAFCAGPYDELLQEIPGLGHIDVMCAGGAYGREWGGRQALYAQLLDERHLGCRAFAASFHDRAAARAAIEKNHVDLAFIRFNPTHPGGRAEVLGAVDAQTKTKVFAFKTTWGLLSEAQLYEAGLGSENWVPTRGDLYRYALSTIGFSGVLIAPKSSDHLDQLQSAVDEGPLSASEMTYLETLCAHLER